MLHFVSADPSHELRQSNIGIYVPEKDSYRQTKAPDTVRTVHRPDGAVEVHLQASGSILTGVVLSMDQATALGYDLARINSNGFIGS